MGTYVHIVFQGEVSSSYRISMHEAPDSSSYLTGEKDDQASKELRGDIEIY